MIPANGLTRNSPTCLQGASIPTSAIYHLKLTLLREPGKYECTHIEARKEVFETAYQQKLPVLQKGPTGCGKTRFIEYMAW